ncbi:MAG TPA: type I-E CRISPR-associated protein Cse1/CasA [Candidatus Bathyarchaeia archaeon]|nr:type I-E CRISPR-associated protein Cse1/CasA [Candidatus Bathyarchaeia archaeon]
MNSYNLLSQNWIPVLYHNGDFKRVGILKAFQDAHRIRQVAASNPMDRLAILRFLLALLYWCKGNPANGPQAAPYEPFPPDWFLKLEQNKECFDLFGETRRFYQYKKPVGEDKRLTANYLVHEVPTGTNAWHFRHSTDEVNGLCRACCAMGLLRLPAFATSGGRGKPPGINSKPPLYVIPLRGSLAATVRLSWRPVGPLGTPAWEKPDVQLPGIGEVPLLTGLTWLPRRVWLDSPAERAETCISCGRSERLILRTVFAPIGSTKTEEGEPVRAWCDPHVIYGMSAKGEISSLHARDALGAPDAAAGQWANILAGLLRKGQTGNASPCWIVGFSTVQNDKYLEAVECQIPCDIDQAPQEQRDECLNNLEQWRKGKWGFAKNLGSDNEKGERREHREITSMLASIGPHVEKQVSEKSGSLIAGGETAWQEAAKAFRPMMRLAAQSLSPGFTIQAARIRKRIANAMPNMTPKAAKKGRGKGRDK